MTTAKVSPLQLPSAPTTGALPSARTHKKRIQLRTAAEIAALCAFCQRKAIDLKRAAEIYDRLDTNGDGHVTVEDLEGGIEDAGLKEFIQRARNGALSSLSKGHKKTEIKQCFAKIDTDVDGIITKTEWLEFLEKVALERVRYLKIQGLMRRRCFWGLGIEEKTGTRVEKIFDSFFTSLTKFGLKPRPVGFVSDFSFYVSNFHNLLALFCRDGDHPISPKEQIVMFLLLQAYSLWMALNLAIQNYDIFTSQALSLLLITIPNLILAEVFFFLFACPCAHYERHGAGSETLARLKHGLIESLGYLSALPFAFFGVLLTLASIRLLVRHRRGLDAWVVFDYAFGVTLSYILWPFKILLFQFNLANTDKGGMKLVHFLTCHQFGRWRQERSVALHQPPKIDGITSLPSMASDDGLDDDHHHHGPTTTNHVSLSLPSRGGEPPSSVVVFDNTVTANAPAPGGPFVVVDNGTSSSSSLTTGGCQCLINLDNSPLDNNN